MTQEAAVESSGKGLLGVKNLYVKKILLQDTDNANAFLREHDGHIVDIKFSTTESVDYILVIYTKTLDQKIIKS